MKLIEHVNFSFVHLFMSININLKDQFSGIIFFYYNLKIIAFY